MILVDTSVLIDHLRGRRQATDFLATHLSAGDDVVASELTRFELVAGVPTDERTALDQLATALSWVPVTQEISTRAGDYAREHRRSHSGAGAVDYLLAGTATVLGTEIATMNVRHFPMFPDLRPPYRYDSSS